MEAKDLKVFSVFSWLLKPEHRTRVQELVKMSVAQGDAQALARATSAAAVATSHAASSSSSSSIATAGKAKASKLGIDPGDWTMTLFKKKRIN